MMNRAACMTMADLRPACAILAKAYYAFTSAACFSVLRFRFYYFSHYLLS